MLRDDCFAHGKCTAMAIFNALFYTKLEGDALHDGHQAPHALFTLFKTLLGFIFKLTTNVS